MFKIKSNILYYSVCIDYRENSTCFNNPRSEAAVTEI